MAPVTRSNARGRSFVVPDGITREPVESHNILAPVVGF